MKKVIITATIFLLVAFLSGCPKKATIVKENANVPPNTKAQADAETEAKAKAEAEDNANKKAEAKAKADAETKAKAEAEAGARAKETFRVEDIHFDFDKSSVKDSDRKILKSLAEWLLNHKEATIQIEGHCDERGTTEYNLALAERRAHSAKEYLETIGINKNRISAITYGKEKPLCTEHNEECWWKNRRGQFVLKEQNGAKVAGFKK